MEKLSHAIEPKEKLLEGGERGECNSLEEKGTPEERNTWGRGT